MKHRKYKLPPRCREIPITPYPGRVFAAATKTAYIKAHRIIFGEGASISDTSSGYCACADGKDGLTTWLIWADELSCWSHEAAHVCLDLLPRLGFDLNEGNCQEAFCYLIHHIVKEASKI